MPRLQKYDDDKRPFAFEDLEGAPEPERWGPLYPKTASAAVEKWRQVNRGRELTAEETAAYGGAVHQWIHSLNAVKPRQGLAIKSNCVSGQAEEFCAKKHRASLIAKLHAQCAADKRAWAEGRSTNRHGVGIREAYAAAMTERARLAHEAAQMREAA